jgi:hypothetical protein
MESTALFLWKDWSPNMRLANLSEDGKTFRLSGECPHCGDKSVFQTVGSLYEDRRSAPRTRLVGVASCIGCSECILAKINNFDGSGYDWNYEGHYPLGKPHDKVEEEIPENIRLDFQEALRCQYINAHNATAEMCRRSVESACIDLGAPYSRVLNDMIDWLESNRKITPGLKAVAHQIRLGGDRAAHAPEEPGAPLKYQPMIVIEEEHANAIVEYTRHFLEHVYVIPMRLPTYDFSKPKKKANA